MAARHFVADGDNVCAEPLREELRFFEFLSQPLHLLLVVLRAEVVGHHPLLALVMQYYCLGLCRVCACSASGTARRDSFSEMRSRQSVLQSARRTDASATDRCARIDVGRDSGEGEGNGRMR